MSVMTPYHHSLTKKNSKNSIKSLPPVEDIGGARNISIERNNVGENSPKKKLNPIKMVPERV